MEIGGINTAGLNQQPQQTGSGAALGKDEFLQLLITQLRHQDPLNPMEGTEFATQLAQFNSVEQLINVNSGIEQLASAQNIMSTGLNNSLAATLTGKSVRALSNQIQTDGSSGGEIHFRLQNLASSTEILIRDQNGSVVRKETIDNLGEGDHSWKWDGKSGDGIRMAEGTYTFEVKASNGDDPVNSITFIEGFVEKVRFTGSGVRLLVNGVELPLGDVEEIGSDTES